jgi:hypothetical protein
VKALALAQKLLALPLFTRREEIKSKTEIIKWWELRRIPFNPNSEVETRKGA